MKTLSIYLTFDKCEEALNFYKKALNGEIISIQRFGETQMPVTPADKDKIVHSLFKAEGISFMASDAMQHKLTIGNNVTLNIEVDDEKLQDTIFNNLAEGGTITMPLQDTFWGARFGMLTDKYGICWMSNCEKK